MFFRDEPGIPSAQHWPFVLEKDGDLIAAYFNKQV
jgi:hypothetical protein